MADASYIVDIAATFKGEQTIAQMDALTSKLVSAGANAESFQAAIVQVSRSLDAAAAASVAANAALADGNAEYKLLEQAANQAAKAQEKAARLGVVPPAVAASVLSTSAALEAHTAELAKLEAAAKQASAEEKGFATSLANVRKLAAATAADEKAAAAQSDRNLKKLKAGLAGIGGPLGSVGAAGASAVDDFRDLEEALGTTGAQLVTVAAGFATAAVAVAAITVAVLAATVAIGAWAIGLADSNRNAALAQQASEALHPELIGLRDTFKALGAETGIHADELSSYAGQLKEAKVAAEDIPDALRAIALSEAALGKGGSADFLKDVRAGKVAVSALSAEVNSKLGGVVRQQMIGLSAQSQRFHENIANLFGGLEIEPVLLGLQKLVALFDANTEAGAALKFLFEAFFQPLIDQALSAATAVEAFALGVLIGLTKMYIAAKPAIKVIADLFGFDDTSTADTMAKITAAAEYLAPALAVGAGIFVAFAVAVGAVVAVAVGVQLAVYAMGAAVVYVGAQIVSGVIGAWNAVTSFLDSITLEDVGMAIMQGLANGIAAAAGLPLEAITGAARAAIAGAKAVLGIHSPSRVFAEIGGYTAEGFAEGVDEGAGEAQSAMVRMAEPPQITVAGATSTGSKGAESSASKPAISGNTFNLYGVKDAEHAVGMIEEAITRLLEGDAMQAEGATA